jgi:hypothetical protein
MVAADERDRRVAATPVNECFEIDLTRKRLILLLMTVREGVCVYAEIKGGVGSSERPVVDEVVTVVGVQVVTLKYYMYGVLLYLVLPLYQVQV